MAITPNPQLYDLAREGMTLEESERIKHADCVHYERCLDRACKVDWPQFHCQACLAYQAVILDITSVECAEPSYSLVQIGRSFTGSSR